MTQPSKSPLSNSTLRPPSERSWIDWLASIERLKQRRLLDSLTSRAVASFPTLFDFWALDHQLPPLGDWRTWVILGGRGAGKTRAGSEWVRRMVEGPTPEAPGAARRVALIGETLKQGVEVMVFGESGIMACTPADRQPRYSAGRHLLEWPNGATAQLFSANQPESLRGPQFDLAWADELAKWPKGAETWEMLGFCLRLGAAPRICVTTTPRSVPVLREILAQPSTVVTQASTFENSRNLAPGFLEEMRRRHAGTPLGQQELEGVLLERLDGALWPEAVLGAAVVARAPALDRIVVAVDPAVTSRQSSDACGIIVAGVVQDGPPQDWVVYLLEDLSVRGLPPEEWTARVLGAFDAHQADLVVAEVNQGGEMVEGLLKSQRALVPFRAVRADRSKARRAQPVAALYGRGRVKHLRGLSELEDEMRQMTLAGYQGAGSPDRLDAAVWAIHELLIEPAKTLRPAPRPAVRFF